jgi:uncharacterized protein YecE (DUF72 family)
MLRAMVRPSSPPAQQESLFDLPVPAPPRVAWGATDDARMAPAPQGAAVHALAARLSPRIHLGTSSWSFPGWQDLVWAGEHSTTALAQQGLAVYARHPLLRCVSLDRAFYRPLRADQYADYAVQVPADFRFMVKAPALITDAVTRDAQGRGVQPNPAFLDPALAVSEFAQPALDGLGMRLGALVFEIPPLPPALRGDIDRLLPRLARLLHALPRLTARAPDAVVSVEVRDPEWLTPAFVAVLKDAGARYCLGLHPRLPPLEAQLPLLRALWPGPFVCRWSLNRRHGARGYDAAKARYAPFNRMVDPDPETRRGLARVVRATALAGFPVYVTVNNKAEGSAPLSVQALAEAVDSAV